MSWYIETWNAADGLAFISRRDEKNAIEVFFVGAPQFHPLPIRQVATALWAARGTFQEGVLDVRRPKPKPGGDPLGTAFAEIEFQTLEQAIEFVRRMFIALGPDDTPGSFTPLPQLPLISPSGAELVERAVASLTDCSAKTKLDEILKELSRRADYQKCLREVLIAALAQMPAATESTPELDEHRVALLVLLEKSSLWEGAGHIMGHWADYASTTTELARPPRWDIAHTTGSAGGMQARLVNGLLFKIPAPVSMPSPYLRGLPTLGHHVCAAASDRAYLALLDTPVRFLPLHAASLLLAAATIDWAPASKLYFASLVDKASSWISASVADRTLADIEAAESLITSVVQDLAKTNEPSFSAIHTPVLTEADTEVEIEDDPRSPRLEALLKRKRQVGITPRKERHDTERETVDNLTSHPHVHAHAPIKSR